MPALQPIEWRDINGLRAFPFSDDASRRDADGDTLPRDAFVDAILYPIGTSGSLYLSAVDPVAALVTVTDSGTGDTVATGAITPDDTIDLLDADSRPAGVLVKGPGFTLVTTARTFTAAATPFAAACLFPQNQPGVRAFRLPDGRLITGDVLFVGENGYYVTTGLVGGKVVVRADALGENPSLDCTQLPPPVKCLRVSQVAGSLLTVSQAVTAEGVLIYLGARVGMADICPPKRVPDAGGVIPPPPVDPCLEVPTPTPPPTPPPVPPSICVTGNGRVFIIPTSTLLAINPSDEPAAASPPLESMSTSTLSKILNDLPPRDAQGVEIRLKGWAI